MWHRVDTVTNNQTDSIIWTRQHRNEIIYCTPVKHTSETSNWIINAIDTLCTRWIISKNTGNLYEGILAFLVGCLLKFSFFGAFSIRRLSFIEARLIKRLCMTHSLIVWLMFRSLVVGGYKKSYNVYFYDVKLLF